ncbi:MAG: HU family DNA-binding protein [Spirochaetaceae bacterium]|jgi:predicted histone-like DNA-binding protein|nr:HU family DNA-binding protein [Spirochaetaceae bacterium]
MSIKLRKIQRKNPVNPDVVKWYFTQEKSGTVGMKDIANEIAKRSSMSVGDVQAVLTTLVDSMPLYLKLGQTIKLEGFGSFRISVTSEGMETPEELGTHHVKGTKLLFQPSTNLKRDLTDISFETIDDD